MASMAVAATLVFHVAPFRFASGAEASASYSNWKVKRKDQGSLAAIRSSIYLSGVTRSFIRFLTLLALLLAPLSMMTSHAAMAAAVDAAPASASAMHCAEMPQADNQAPGKQAPVKNIDCMLACACLPPLSGPGVGQAQLLISIDPVANAEPLGHGLDFTADPPPPRFS